MAGSVACTTGQQKAVNKILNLFKAYQLYMKILPLQKGGFSCFVEPVSGMGVSLKIKG
jgi:hypothetical protein